MTVKGGMAGAAVGAAKEVVAGMTAEAAELKTGPSCSPGLFFYDFFANLVLEGANLVLEGANLVLHGANLVLHGANLQIIL